MFQKCCVFMVFAGLVGVAGAAEKIPQVITSEVFSDSVTEQYVQKEPVYEESANISEPDYEDSGEFYYEESGMVPEQHSMPVWPLAGSEADVEIACGESGCSNNKKIVSKIGTGLVIENNIITDGAGWTGGPNITNGNQIPAGFDYECANSAEMPLMRREMMEDDGGTVLAMSRSGHKNCNKYKSADSYAVFAQRAGFAAEASCNSNKTMAIAVGEDGVPEVEAEVAVNETTDEVAPKQIQDQVRSWVVANGQTLRQVLQSWCDKEGWDLVWTTSREYPIEASAVFKGRFVDVASALVRNFGRATPIPYAKFYKGNRVLVISTTEE